MTELILNSFQVVDGEIQEAFFWVPILIGAAILLRGSVWVMVTTNLTKLEGCSLGILGMPGSGKTQFLNNLKGEDYSVYEQTIQSSPYKSFSFETKDKTINIKEGEDIGGDESNIRYYYIKFLQEKDVVIFLFDLQKYTEDDRYFRNTNVRLDFINRHVKEESKWAIIGTHLDKVKEEERKNIILRIQKMVEGKSYGRLLGNNFIACDLTQKDHMEMIKQKLF